VPTAWTVKTKEAIRQRLLLKQLEGSALHITGSGGEPVFAVTHQTARRDIMELESRWQTAASHVGGEMNFRIPLNQASYVIAHPANATGQGVRLANVWRTLSRTARRSFLTRGNHLRGPCACSLYDVATCAWSAIACVSAALTSLK